MTALVWVSDWEIQCCGAEFGVGDSVDWPVTPVDRSDSFWEPVLGGELTAALTHVYDAHAEPAVPASPATVSAIRTVSCRYAPAPPPADARELRIVPGTAVVEPVESIEKWYGTDPDPDGLTFRGWLVDVDLGGSS